MEINLFHSSHINMKSQVNTGLVNKIKVGFLLVQVWDLCASASFVLADVSSSSFLQASASYHRNYIDILDKGKH